MRIVTAIVLIALIICTLGCSKGRGEHTPFSPTPETIKEAMEYGKNSTCQRGDFRIYDFGFNRFDLGDEVGYICIITPFVKIADKARQKKDSGGELSFEDAEKIAKKPSRIWIVLHLMKNKMDIERECALKVAGETIDLSDNVSTSAYWDENTGKGVKLYSYYDFPVEKVGDEPEFTLIFKGEDIGERNIRVKLSELR